MEDYRTLHQRSVEDPEGFWGERPAWSTGSSKPKRILDDDHPPFYRWFPDGDPEHLLQRSGPPRRRAATVTGTR